MENCALESNGPKHRGGMGGTLRCWTCNDTGHVASNCPERGEWRDYGKGGGGGAEHRSGGEGAGSSSSAGQSAAPTAAVAVRAVAMPAAPTAAAAPDFDPLVTWAGVKNMATNVPYPAAPAVIHHPAAVFQSCDSWSGQWEEVQIWDLAHFQSCDSWVDTHKQHNAALKWFRQEFESAVAGQSMVLPNSCEIPAIVKGRGMDWDFNRAVLVKWSWHEMVAQLDAESMRVVVEGDAGRSGGLIRCELLPRPGFKYDHKLHHQLKDAGRAERNTQLRVWDFVLTRDDGSGLRLHPQWKSTKVDTYAVEGGEGLQPPRAGLGESDGPGTYRRYKEAGNQRSLRFDATKRPR